MTQSEYEVIEGHQNNQAEGWSVVQHRENGTKHIYHRRCHKLTPFTQGDQPHCQWCPNAYLRRDTPSPSPNDPDANFDARGNPIPLKSVSGFTHYDSSRGHCGLCGSMTCRDNCFK